jgi:hypothetical protein
MNTKNPTRRNILSAALAATGAVIAPAASAAEEKEANGAKPEFYELRAYRLRRGPMGKRLDEYLKDALIPAVRRAGCGPVGAFSVVVGDASPSTHLLIPHPSAESFVTLSERLSADAEYKKAGAAVMTLPPTDPAYAGMEVQLLRAFPHTPKLEVPEAKPRIFELRTYRSHSRAAGQKKIEMFDTGGEVAIFRRNGLTPVFFAQTLTGSHMPSLTYMLTFPDLATREKNWNTFRNDPEWKKLSGTPGYTDAEIVTDINNQVLAPTAYSQV